MFSNVESQSATTNSNFPFSKRTTSVKLDISTEILPWRRPLKHGARIERWVAAAVDCWLHQREDKFQFL